MKCAIPGPQRLRRLLSFLLLCFELFSCNAGGVVAELHESEATPTVMDAMLSPDVDKALGASVASFSQPPVHRSPPPAADVDPTKPGHAASDRLIAETASRVSPSDQLRRQSLSPTDRISTNHTEVSQRDADMSELRSPALCGIMHTVFLFVLLLYRRGARFLHLI